jgi:hypothetical protein
MAKIKSAVPVPLRSPSDPDEQRVLPISQWQSEPSFPACRSGEDIYLAIRSLCSYFGVASRNQIDSLQRHKLLGRYMRMFYVNTRGGKQPTWCLHVRAVPLWVVLLDLDEIKPELQHGVIEWDDVILNEAARLFWGAESGVIAPSTPPAILPIISAGNDIAALDAKIEQSSRYHESLIRMLAARMSKIEKQVLPQNVYYDVEGEADISDEDE